MKKNSKENSKKSKLSIKSKLLFNNLDMQYKIILDYEQKLEKRLRGLQGIFSVYRITVEPFIRDESISYRDKVFSALTKKQEKLKEMISSSLSKETITLELDPIIDHLKDMISTCKINLGTLNSLLEVKL